MANKLTIDINTPAPKWWKFISRTVRFFCSGFVTMLATGNPFSTAEVKNTALFILGIILLLMGALDAGFGTAQSDPEIKEETNKTE